VNVKGSWSSFAKSYEQQGNGTIRTPSALIGDRTIASDQINLLSDPPV
jgi:hypothetical protein